MDVWCSYLRAVTLCTFAFVLAVMLALARSQTVPLHCGCYHWGCTAWCCWPKVSQAFGTAPPRACGLGKEAREIFVGALTTAKPHCERPQILPLASQGCQRSVLHLLARWPFACHVFACTILVKRFSLLDPAVGSKPPTFPPFLVPGLPSLVLLAHRFVRGLRHSSTAGVWSWQE